MLEKHVAGVTGAELYAAPIATAEKKKKRERERERGKKKPKSYLRAPGVYCFC